MSILESLCPDHQFNEPWDYGQFMRNLHSLVEERRIIKIEPKARGEWEQHADFFYDPASGEIYVLHHPEAPSRGLWEKRTDLALMN